MSRASGSKRTPIRRASAKFVDAARVLAEARLAVIARSGGRCEAHEPACSSSPHPGVLAHHVKPRGRSSRDPLIRHDPTNLLWICNNAHAWIHGNPERANGHGWLKHSWE